VCSLDSDLQKDCLQFQVFSAPVINVSRNALNVDIFSYVGWILASDGTIDSNIDACLAKAGSSFGLLSKQLWDNRRIWTDTDVALYSRVILTVVAQEWSLDLVLLTYCKLDWFHLHGLRRMMFIKCPNHISNAELLGICIATGIEAHLMAAELHWSRHFY